MKRIWKILLIVAAVFALLAITCPGQGRHTTAVVNRISRSIHQETKKVTGGMDLENDEKAELKRLEDQLTGQFQDALEHSLKVRRYVLFSIAHLDGEESTTVSVGVLGLVFVNKKPIQTTFNFHHQGYRKVD